MSRLLPALLVALAAPGCGPGQAQETRDDRGVDPGADVGFAGGDDAGGPGGAPVGGDDGIGEGDTSDVETGSGADAGSPGNSSGDHDADSDSSSDGDAGGDSDAPLGPSPDGLIEGPPAAPCDELSHAPAQSVSGFAADEYVWFDAACRRRSAALVKNDRMDPAGKWGGYARRFTYEISDGDLEGVARSCESSHPDHPGFGYAVNHLASGGSVSSRKNRGTYEVLLAGRHHALHAYRWTYAIGGQTLGVTVHWLFATGRSHPVWSVTFDTSRAADGAVNADSRAPYGDIDWDGGAKAEVSGVGWGDRYKLTSLASPLTMASGWDYTAPNTVPYVLSWASGPDAEMGLVQTQTFSQHDAGGYGFYTSWGKRDADGPMPPDSQWPYQVNQYELPFTTRSKRLAWGTNYGAVGKSRYDVFGQDGKAAGYPYQSYAVHVVLDRHSRAPVAEQVAEVEAVQGTRLSAAVGGVVAEGPAGVERDDSTTYSPAGYDHVYGVWTLAAADGRLDASFDVTAGALRSPVFAITQWTSSSPPARVRLGDRELVADVDYYATVDTARGRLWLTLSGTYAGPSRLRLD